MLKSFQPLANRVEGVAVTLRSYAFQAENKVIQLSEDKVQAADTAPSDNQALLNCFAVTLSRSASVRSGAIDTIQKANQFIRLLQNIYESLVKTSHQSRLPLRAVSIQLNDPETEWELITSQHESLVSADLEHHLVNNVVHLNLSFDRYFILNRPQMYIASTIRNIHRMAKFQNMEAWAIYCFWLNEGLEDKLKSFLADALDEYQLEARFKDFRHEAQSGLLQGYLKEASELTRKIGQINELIKSGQKDARNAAALLESAEKDLVRVQGEIRISVKAQHELIRQIEMGIVKIEHSHPELIDIKNKVTLIRMLLDHQLDFVEEAKVDIGYDIMLLSLLNEQLGIVSCYNCDLGLERTTLAYSIGLAILQLRERSSMTRVMDMVMNWHNTTKAINKLYSQKGIEGFSDWLKQPGQNEAETVLIKRAAIVMRFRHFVWMNLRRFGSKIAEINSRKQQQKVRPITKENIAYLNFLPPFHDILNDKGEREPARIYKTDPITGDPAGLTPHGHHLMMQLSDI